VTKSLITALTAALLVAADPCPEPEDAGKQDLKKLQGNWAIASVQSEGKPDRKEKEAPGVTMVVKGDQLTIKEPKREETVTFVLDAKKKPREITLKVKGEKGIPGIYKIEGETFTICFSKGGTDPRPKQFTTKPGSTHTLIVFKRKKP
jgi:uncharacterized protein (TIGR03067 family)